MTNDEEDNVFDQDENDEVDENDEEEEEEDEEDEEEEDENKDIAEDKSAENDPRRRRCSGKISKKCEYNNANIYLFI